MLNTHYDADPFPRAEPITAKKLEMRMKKHAEEVTLHSKMKQKQKHFYVQFPQGGKFCSHQMQNFLSCSFFTFFSSQPSRCFCLTISTSCQLSAQVCLSFLFDVQLVCYNIQGDDSRHGGNKIYRKQVAGMHFDIPLERTQSMCCDALKLLQELRTV